MDNNFFAKLYNTAVSESLNCSDRDAFTSDFCLSSIWGDGQDADVDLSARSEWCGQLWDATHRTFKDIARESGLSQRALAQRFCIPLRTAEDWGRGASSCPIYTRLMMQECLGLYKNGM